jgi:prolycopene isomerase
VTHLFSLLGSDYPRARPQTHIRRYLGEGFDYLLTNKPDELKRQWQEEFPEDAPGIERFFAAAKRLAKAFREYGHVFRAGEAMGFFEGLNSKRKLLKFALPFIPFIRYNGEAGLKKGLRKYFTASKLHQVFAADTELLSCLIPIAWAYNGDFQSPPEGGGQRIPEWLAHTALAHGGDIAYQCHVQQILLDGNTCTGVRLSRRGAPYDVRAKHVIAACDVEMLYERLLPPGAVPQKIKDRLRRADLYSSSVTVSIALDCPPAELGFGEELIHIAGAPGLAHAGVTNDAATSEISILAPSFRDPLLAPEGMGTLTLYMPADMSFKDTWHTEQDTAGITKRGNAYNTLKSEVAETLISRVAALVAPRLREHILFYEVATPVTHWRYTGNRGGTMMGAKPGRANMQNGVARYRTPVKNLLLGGHWAELGGGVPIAVKAGANAALMVLRSERPKAAKALAGYMDEKLSLAKALGGYPWQAAPDNWVPKPTPAERKRER